jgi:chromosome segregation ATPase
MSIKNEIQKHWLNLKAEIEAFALQMSLGKSEAKDRLTDFQKEINSELAEWQEKINRYEKENEPLIRSIRQEIDTFRVQMELGKAETKEQLDEYSKKSKAAYDKLAETIAKKLEENQQLRTEWEEAMSKIDSQMSKVKGAVEGLRLQMSLGEAEAKDELDKIKKDLNEKVEVFQKSAEENFEGKLSDLQKWFDNFRTDLANKIKP